MSVVEPIWIDSQKDRRQFFSQELMNYLDALEAQGPTYDTLDEAGCSFPQLFPDSVSPEMKKYQNDQYRKALDKLNRKGDEWDRLHPNDKSKRVPVKF